jgi:hypothetical protein
MCYAKPLSADFFKCVPCADGEQMRAQGADLYVHRQLNLVVGLSVLSLAVYFIDDFLDSFFQQVKLEFRQTLFLSLSLARVLPACIAAPGVPSPGTPELRICQRWVYHAELRVREPLRPVTDSQSSVLSTLPLPSHNRENFRGYETRPGQNLQSCHIPSPQH